MTFTIARCVVADRVPRDRLASADHDLQPAQEWDPIAFPAKAVFIDAGDAVREYPRNLGLANSGNPKSFSFSSEVAKKNGIWNFRHQFQEFGVFYLSVWICPDNKKSPCDSQDPKHLVPGTGLPIEDGNIPLSAFTVCPQGTDAVPDNKNTGMMLGSKLSTCNAQVGYFSPEGPGHIAEKCDERGFFCGYNGMTWPVAKPGYWCAQFHAIYMRQRSMVHYPDHNPWLRLRRVDAYKPTVVKVCPSLGACPGGMQFGVGTDEWRRLGDTGDGREAGVPMQSCWGIPNEDNRWLKDNHTLRFSDCGAVGGACIDKNKMLSSNGCFTDTTFITRGKGTGVYNLKQGLLNGTVHRCRDEVGSRCCPGNRGDGCQLCCLKENLANSDKTRSYNHKQWHSIDTSPGLGSCYVCPDSNLNAGFFVVFGFLVLLFAPVIAKGAELAKHAGAAQGPCSPSLKSRHL